MFNDSRLVESDTDLSAYVSELKTPWKTMGPDMDTAFKIISHHAKTELELELLSVSAEGGELAITFPDWQSQMEKAFVEQYGLNNGRTIFNKVMMRLYLMSKGQAQPLH